MLRLKELREAHNPPLTQEALAHAAGVSLRTVARAEANGQASAAILRKFAFGLGVPISGLFPEEAAS